MDSFLRSSMLQIDIFEDDIFVRTARSQASSDQSATGPTYSRVHMHVITEVMFKRIDVLVLVENI